jgi:RNA polymerase sigma-70 factor (ECF subfamily)
MDRDRFASLLQDHKDAVYGYALHLSGNVEDAQDVTQHVFLTLWRVGGTVQEGALRGWLLRVCRNACFDLYRRRKVRQATHLDALEDPGTGRARAVGGRDDPGAAGSARSLEVSDGGQGALQIEQRVEAAWVVRSMQELSEQQRAVLVLREVHDMTYEDIASNLGLTLASVKVTLHRARHRLRDLLEQRASKGAQA